MSISKDRASAQPVPGKREPAWQQQVLATRRGPIGRWARREQDRSTASLSALIRQLLGRQGN